jgi:hypothetical protein
MHGRKLLDPDPDGLVWPLLTGDLQLKVKKKCANATLQEACNRQLPNTNFMEQISISGAAVRWQWSCGTILVS